MEGFRFNTAIAALMELNNYLFKARESSVVNTATWNQAVRDLMLMMAPIFPHIADELWHRQGNTSSVHLQRWPEGDPETRRARKRSPSSCRSTARCATSWWSRPERPAPNWSSRRWRWPTSRKWLDGKPARKVIVVPDKLVNIVMG